MADGERLGGVDDFEEGLVRNVVLGRRRIAVVRLEGRFYAFDNECTHLGAALSGQSVDATGEIECSHHGARFDARTGAVLRGPADEDLHTYAVATEGSDVMLQDAG